MWSEWERGEAAGDRYNESIRKNENIDIMDAAHCDRPLTETEYLAWEACQDIRHEFIDGAVVAMTGGSLCHNDLTVKLILDIASNSLSIIRSRQEIVTWIH